MKRSVMVAVMVAILASILAATPAMAAAPFGSFGGKVGGGNAGGGLLPLHGWALDDDGVQAVDILVDGIVVGRASYGRSRPGVTALFPGFPDTLLPGFAFELDTTHFLNGLHTVQARVLSKSGETALLQARTFQFLNASHNLHPFGRIEFPAPNAQLWGACNLDAQPVHTAVTGYALDAGLQPQDTGVGYVELLIDRALWANSKTECTFSAARGGLSDCYGLVRQDIEQFFPSLDDSLHSGFRFVLDVGFLVGSGLYTRGHHTLSVRAGDHGDQDSTIHEISVTFNCFEDFPNAGSIGDVLGIRPGMLVGGIVFVDGWALDIHGVKTVQVAVDGIFVGNATYGLPNSQVSSNFPGYPNSVLPGFLFPLDTRLLSNGVHFLNVTVIDNLNQPTLIAERRFVVGNPEP